ncbi:hypothetical protein SALBM311S_01278 [Streptomyces alboniger]
MSLLARPKVAALAAKTMQRMTVLADRRSGGRGSAAASHARCSRIPAHGTGLDHPDLDRHRRRATV